MPAGSAMTSASARQARCINRAAEAWLHSAGHRKSPAEAGLSLRGTQVPVRRQTHH